MRSIPGPLTSYEKYVSEFGEKEPEGIHANFVGMLHPGFLKDAGVSDALFSKCVSRGTPMTAKEFIDDTCLHDGVYSAFGIKEAGFESFVNKVSNLDILF